MLATIRLLSIAVLLSALAAGSTMAAPVTLEGKVVCAKCTLHEKGRDECQNVLIVETKGGPTQYYIAKNDVSEKYGDVCTSVNPVRVTGEVTKKDDGRQWVVATEIRAVETKS